MNRYDRFIRSGGDRDGLSALERRLFRRLVVAWALCMALFIALAVLMPR